MCKIFTNTHSTLAFCRLQKNNLSWLNNLFLASFNSLEFALMLITNYWCVQSLNISVDVAKCIDKFHKFTKNNHFLSVTKNDLSWLNNLFMARFPLMRMFSYAKNKLMMCSVNQHQCRRRQMCGKFSQFHEVHSRLSVTKNDLNYLFMARFQPISMCSVDNNKLLMCSVTQHQCRRR